ncbi:MAG: glycosyltransferase, partial [Gammaproteobacteria bacterium]|nr:glycosyltransferase [Gammaproteobacteria bacterium]
MSELSLLLLNGLWALAALMFLLPLAVTYFFRQQLEPAEVKDGQRCPAVSVIIPARNEAHNIGQALQAVTQLDYPKTQVEVIVVDDRSSDRTAAIVRDFMIEHEEISLLDAPPLEADWTGKANACHFGAEQAQGDWLVFLDADTYVRPALLVSAVDYAAANRVGLLSLIPFQIAASFQERIALPLIFLAFASVIDFRRVNDPADTQAVANGQFLLFARDAYRRIGGHRAVRSELSDDLAFARRAKALGVGFRCLFADRLVETRMYRSLAEVWRGFSRNAVEIMRIDTLSQLLLQSARSLLLAGGLLLLPAMTLLSEAGPGVQVMA